MIGEAQLREWGEASSSRTELWTRFVGETEAATVAEIGVYRGQFAESCSATARASRPTT